MHPNAMRSICTKEWLKKGRCDCCHCCDDLKMECTGFKEAQSGKTSPPEAKFASCQWRRPSNRKFKGIGRKIKLASGYRLRCGTFKKSSYSWSHRCTSGPCLSKVWSGISDFWICNNLVGLILTSFHVPQDWISVECRRLIRVKASSKAYLNLSQTDLADVWHHLLSMSLKCIDEL